MIKDNLPSHHPKDFHGNDVARGYGIPSQNHLEVAKFCEGYDLGLVLKIIRLDFGILPARLWELGRSNPSKCSGVNALLTPFSSGLVRSGETARDMGGLVALLEPKVGQKRVNSGKNEARDGWGDLSIGILGSDPESLPHSEKRMALLRLPPYLILWPHWDFRSARTSPSPRSGFLPGFIFERMVREGECTIIFFGISFARRGLPTLANVVLTVLIVCHWAH